MTTKKAGKAANPDIDGLVNDYLDHRAAAEKHQQMAKETGEQIAKILGPGGRHEIADGVGVSVSKPASRYDEATARSVLTEEQLAAITTTVTKLDFKKAEELWGTAMTDQLKKTGSKATVRTL